MSSGEWIEDRYFDGLLREADACALRDIFRVNASVETQRRADQSMHNGWPLSVRSRCQPLGAKDLGLLFLIEGRLNVCFKPAETWKELAKQVDDVNSRHFAARGRP